MEIDIENKCNYEYDKPRDRTRARLEEIISLGMKDVGVQDFGIPGIMSGLYIERVWNMSDKDWNDYMNWVKSLIQEKQNGKI